jgi:Poly(A) polymerase central domain
LFSFKPLAIAVRVPVYVHESQVETNPGLAARVTTNGSMVHALLAVVNSTVLVRRVPKAATFRELLRVVRSWAQSRYVYGAKNGFLGGFHWSCLVARVQYSAPLFSVFVFPSGVCVAGNFVTDLHGCTQ